MPRDRSGAKISEAQDLAIYKRNQLRKRDDHALQLHYHGAFYALIEMAKTQEVKLEPFVPRAEDHSRPLQVEQSEAESSSDEEDAWSEESK